MATTPEAPERPSELLEIEEHALEHLEEPHEGVEALPDLTEKEPAVPVGRLAVVVAFSVLAAAVMVGGVYKGISPRLWAALAGLMGIGVAVFVRRLRNAILSNLVIAAAIFFIGVILTIPAGSVEDVLSLGPFVRDAVSSGDVLRPPVPFELGWRAIVGWLMGGLGFSAAWIAIQLKRPSLGLLCPLPIVAIGAISVPEDAKIVSGLLALLLFAIGLGVLSGVELGEGEQRSIGFELRRGLRALPLLAAITVGLYFMASNNFLFPKPLIDPTQEAQRPRTVPLSEVPDRVLFTVQSTVSGPWRMGGLDVYKDGSWLLPPFAENRIEEVPRSGIVDSELQPGVAATFEVRDLGGAVLPGLPNLVGLVAKGPKMAYDSRTGNIRLAEGAIQPGVVYSVVAARIPEIQQLQAVRWSVPKEAARFLDIPPPPPAVQALLAEAPPGKWDRLDYMRQKLLNTVVASGAGTPVPIPPERVQEMLAGSKEGTPYEIVAAQAMLARWAGIPSRIGYGFDGGERVGDRVEVRPKHGASFLEIYFPGFKWLPIIGTPLLAKSQVGGEQTQENDAVLPSDDIAVKVFVPIQIDPRTYLFEQIRRIVFLLAPLIVLLLLLYYGWPGVRKAWIRSRRRAWAQQHGPPERIAVAYADWRDLATDYGYRYGSDTPLMFLDRVIEDEEHSELAWLVTRGLWGDLQDQLTADDANAAEELAKSLRKRMSQAHAWTLRVIAAVSRLSLRYPSAPGLGVEVKEKTPKVKKEERPHEAVAA